MEEKEKNNMYILKKISVMIMCMVVFVTVGLVIVNFQSKIVTLDYYGREIQITTMSNTVEGMLMQNGIYIDERAVVYPSIDNRIEDNMTIKIYIEGTNAELDIERYIEEANSVVTEKIVKSTETFEFGVEKVNNASVARGQITTLQSGVSGEEDVIYTLRYLNGEEIAKNILSNVVIKEMQNQVIEVGTSVSAVSRSSVNRVTADDFVVDSGFKWYDIKLSADLQRYTYNMCKRYGVPYETMLALMYVESGYNENAISSTNDYGICQINICNYNYLNRNLGITDLLNVYDNIKAGTYWIARYYKSWGKYCDGELLERNALNAYNFGDAGYRNYLNNGGTAYSWRYANKIMEVKARLVANGGL